MEQNGIIFDIHGVWQLPSLFNQILIGILHLLLLFQITNKTNINKYSILWAKIKINSMDYISHIPPHKLLCHHTLNNTCSDTVDKILKG